MAFCHWRFKDTAHPLRSLFCSLLCSCWWSKALTRRLWELNTCVKTAKIVSKVNQIWYNTEFLCTALLHNWDTIAGFLQAGCSSSFPSNTVKAVKETQCYQRQSPTLPHCLLIHWLHFAWVVDNAKCIVVTLVCVCVCVCVWCVCVCPRPYVHTIARTRV